MATVNYFEVVLKTYHDDIVARIRYLIDGELIESGLYSVGEINNIIEFWKQDALCGSFALGHKLSKRFTYQLVQDR